MADLRITSNTTLSNLRELAGNDGANLKGKKVDGKLVLYASKNGVGFLAKHFDKFRKRAEEKQTLGRKALEDALTNGFGKGVAKKVMDKIKSDPSADLYLTRTLIDRAGGMAKQLAEDAENDRVRADLPDPLKGSSGGARAYDQKSMEARLVGLKLPDAPPAAHSSGKAATQADLEARFAALKGTEPPDQGRSQRIDRSGAQDPALFRKLGDRARARRAQSRKPGVVSQHKRTMRQPQVRNANRRQCTKQFAAMTKADARGGTSGFRGLLDAAMRRIEHKGGSIDPANLPTEKSRNGQFKPEGLRMIREAIKAGFLAQDAPVADTPEARRAVALDAIEAMLTWNAES
ncbi:MAG: hypothetical protein AAF713_02570 [Pseudomonadota bacterium]